MMDDRQQIKSEEGVRYSVYKDTEGYDTIGVGFLVDSRKGGKMPQPVLDYWFDYALDEKRRALRNAFPWYDRLDPVRKAAMVCWAYQLGIDGVKGFPKALAAIATNQWDEAAKQMLASKWFEQTPGRCKRMAEQIRTGNWQLN